MRGRSLAACAIVAFGIKVWLAAVTVGTNDAAIWEENGAVLRRSGATDLYREGTQLPRPGAQHHYPQRFNHPPLTLHLMTLWNRASDLTGLPVRFWLRLTGAAADLGALLLLSRLFQGASLAIVALSPVAILITGFHGNTDPIMVCLAVASMYLLATGRNAAIAGAVMGVALCVKLPAMIFIPAALTAIPRQRDRVVYACSAAAAFLVSGIPYIWRDPALIFFQTSNYSPIFGVWGVSRALHAALDYAEGATAGRDWLAVIPFLLVAYARLGKWVALAATGWASYALRHSRDVFACAACSVFAFLLLTPGFGVQYLAWAAPWTVRLHPRAALVFHSVTGAFLAGVYLDWCGGAPCRFADSLLRGGARDAWSAPVVALESAAWVTILLCAATLLRELRPVRPPAPAGEGRWRLLGQMR